MPLTRARAIPRARTLSVSAVVAFSMAMIGWMPSGSPAVVLAECGIAREMGTLGAIGDSMVFFANDAKEGYGLWITDGTKRGTRLLKRIPTMTFYYDGTAAGDGVWFATEPRGRQGPQLWHTDGTVKGTRRLHAFGGASENPDVGPRHLVILGPKLSFTAWDEEHGGERWQSDGTSAGTKLLKDIRPGPDGSRQRAWDWPATVSGDSLYFAADDGEHGLELWRTDGTAEGTHLVRDVTPGPAGSWLTPVGAVGDTFYFLVWGKGGATQLWRSDGTVQGTSLVPPELSADSWEALGDTLFFEARDASNPAGLWRIGNTTDDAIPVTGPDWTGDATLEGMAVVGDSLLFATRQGEDSSALWRVDDTATGATYVTDIPTGYWGRDKAVVGETLYFSADDGEHGRELWRSDGTPEGTTLVKDIRPGAKPSSPSGLAGVGDVLFFVARDGKHGHELWRSDGTVTGTRLVRDLRPGLQDSQVGVAAVSPALTQRGSLAYLITSHSCTDHTIWRTDGTRSGTYPLLRTR